MKKINDVYKNCKSEKYDNNEDNSGSNDDKEEEETLFNEGRNIITGCKNWPVFILALYPVLFGVIVSHAGQFLLVVGLTLWIAVIFPCLFFEQSLHPSLTELLFQLPL